MQVTPRFPGIVRAHPEAHRRHRRQGRSTGVDREQPEPDGLRAQGADRRHRHRPADIAWRIRFRTEAGLRRRRPVDDLGRSVDLPAGSQAGQDRRRGADRSRRRRRRYQGRDFLRRAGRRQRHPDRARARRSAESRTAGCGRDCSSPRAWCSPSATVPVAVRVSAIQTLENKTVVFVREEGDKIEARPVELGEMDPKHAWRSETGCPPANATSPKTASS